MEILSWMFCQGKKQLLWSRKGRFHKSLHRDLEKRKGWCFLLFFGLVFCVGRASAEEESLITLLEERAMVEAKRKIVLGSSCRG